MMVKHNEVVAPFQREALDASNVGTWDLDVEGDRFRCDEVSASIYGLSVEESVAGIAIGRAAALVHPDDRAMWRARRLLSLRFGGMFVIEYRVMSRIDEIRWVLVRGRYDIEPDGRISHARGIVIDLTEGKRDRFAEDQASVIDSPVEDGGIDALASVATHTLGAHRALARLGGSIAPTLRIAADRLLQEVGLAIAMTQSPVEDRAKRH